jgi:cell division ATPase FtsA
VSDALDTKQTYEHISDAIKKAETDAQTKITEVIINIPFQELFFEFSKVNYIRKDGEKTINAPELDKIITEVKEISLRKAFHNIKATNSYSKEQLKLIISNINTILLDKVENRKLI